MAPRIGYARNATGGYTPKQLEAARPCRQKARADGSLRYLCSYPTCHGMLGETDADLNTFRYAVPRDRAHRFAALRDLRGQIIRDEWKHIVCLIPTRPEQLPYPVVCPCCTRVCLITA